MNKLYENELCRPLATALAKNALRFVLRGNSKDLLAEEPGSVGTKTFQSHILASFATGSPDLIEFLASASNMRSSARIWACRANGESAFGETVTVISGDYIKGDCLEGYHVCGSNYLKQADSK